jgi:hypothetical protein
VLGSTDNSTFFISKNNAQIFIEGIGLAGGLGTEAPRADILDKFEIETIKVDSNIIKSSDNVSINFCNPINEKLEERFNISLINLNKKIITTDNVVIEID